MLHDTLFWLAQLRVDEVVPLAFLAASGGSVATIAVIMIFDWRSRRTNVFDCLTDFSPAVPEMPRRRSEPLGYYRKPFEERIAHWKPHVVRRANSSTLVKDPLVEESLACWVAVYDSGAQLSLVA